MLGQAAASYSGHYLPSAYHSPTIGTFWTAETGAGLQTAGTLLALLWLGFGYIWFIFVIIGIIDVFAKKQAIYSLSWWALIFPTVTIATAWIELSRSMDSPAISSTDRHADDGPCDCIHRQLGLHHSRDAQWVFGLCSDAAQYGRRGNAESSRSAKASSLTSDWFVGLLYGGQSQIPNVT